MKYIIVFTSLLIFTGCAITPSKNTETTMSSSGIQSSSGSANPRNDQSSVVNESSLVYVEYTLREGSPDGKVIDTSRKSDAEKHAITQSGRIYEPFQVLMSQNTTIVGFRNALIGMKKGEKKIFEVLPKDGYGELTESVVLPDYQIKPVFTKTLDKSVFSDVISQTVQRSLLGEEGKDIKVGQFLTGGNSSSKVKITKIDNDSVTLEMENRHPFYGKKLIPGARVEKEDAIFTIKSVVGTGVTLEVINKSSPFYNSTFEVGSSTEVKNPFQAMAVDGRPILINGKIKVESISEDTVTLNIPNSHPLAGKTLYFDVEVIDIK